MSEERHEELTVEEIKQRLRTGYTFYPTQPGLRQAARELIRPMVEKMDGQEIIYVCRVPRLMHVEYLETDDDAFRAVARTLDHLGCRIPSIAEAAWVEKELNHFATTQEYQVAVNALPADEGARLSWWKQKHQAMVNALPVEPKPLDFGAEWKMLRLSGGAICMNMLTDHFYTDPAVVAEVKTAVARHAIREISAILDRVSGTR